MPIAAYMCTKLHRAAQKENRKENLMSSTLQYGQLLMAKTSIRAVLFVIEKSVADQLKVTKTEMKTANSPVQLLLAICDLERKV